MLILIVDARPETDSEVIVFNNNTAGELVVIITSGAQHRHIVVGIDGRFSSLRREVVMQRDRTGKGVYYSVDLNLGQAQQARLRQMSFDEVAQSREMINRMRVFQLIAGPIT